MSDPDLDFLYFPRLPAELREHIWRYCLPNRICELTQPIANVVFEANDDDDGEEGPLPCNLWRTTYMNSRPPLISRVCRESRAVCFESGSLITDWHEQQPPEAKWISWLDLDMPWRDRFRDAAHLNWHSAYEPEYDHDGDPLRYLGWEATRLRGGDASLMINYLHKFFGFTNSVDLGFATALASFDPDLPVDSPPSDELERVENSDLEILLQHPRWLVVVRVIVVHCDVRSAAKAGLFGLLGDAPVQIVEVSDQSRIQSYFDFAERCERKRQVVVAQDFRQEPTDLVKKKLRGIILRQFHSEELAEKMRPAVMFRLCTQNCHRVENVRIVDCDRMPSWKRSSCRHIVLERVCRKVGQYGLNSIK